MTKHVLTRQTVFKMKIWKLFTGFSRKLRIRTIWFAKVSTVALIQTIKICSAIKKAIKELRNCISRIIRVWSLFCSLWVYTSLHFLPILLENYFCALFLFSACSCRIWCNLHKLYNICKTIVYIVGVRYSVFCSPLLETNCKNIAS